MSEGIFILLFFGYIFAAGYYILNKEEWWEKYLDD